MADWSTAEIVYIPAVACPGCAALRPIIVRSQSEGDGSVSRRCVCRRCAERFVVVVEPPEPLPEFGREDGPLS